MNADDTTIFDIGDSVDEVIFKLKNTEALRSSRVWTKLFSTTPQKERRNDSKQKKITGPFQSRHLDGSIIKWVPHSRLLSVTVDDEFANWISKVFWN